MISTAGLSHIHLAVRDLARSRKFYQTVFGMEDQGVAAEGMVFLRTPGSQDTITLRQASPDESVGSGGGVDHFGFRLTSRADLDSAVQEVTAAGGRLIERGEHAPGVSFAYVADPDGYVMEF